MSFIFSWDSNHLLSNFWQDTWPRDKAIKHFNLLPISVAWPSSVTLPMCQVQGQALNYSPVKTKEQVSLFISLKATALFSHIFGDLEDFSWTDSKWSSFSYEEKNIKTKSTHYNSNKVLESYMSRRKVLAVILIYVPAAWN